MAQYLEYRFVAGGDISERETEPGYLTYSLRSLRFPLVPMLMVLVVALLAGAATSVYELTRPAVYTSNAVLLIDQEPAIVASGGEGIIGKLQALRYKYVGIVGTMTFARPVAQQTGLPEALVHSALSASADANTLLISVTASTHTAHDASLIAQAAAGELVSYLHNEQQSIGVKPQDQVTLTVVSPASAPQQISPHKRRGAFIGLGVFAGVLVIGALLVDLVRPRRL